MAVIGKHLSMSFPAGEDLSANQFFAVTVADRKVANNGAEASGILLSAPVSGEGADCAFIGELPYQAGGAVAAAADLTVATSGYVTAAGSGDYIVGQNGINAVTSGSVGLGLFNFPTAVYAFSSSFPA